MRVLSLALLLGSATAFLAPVKMPARGRAMRMSVDSMLGYVRGILSRIDRPILLNPHSVQRSIDPHPIHD